MLWHSDFNRLAFGMGLAVDRDKTNGGAKMNAYELITERIIEQLEKGTVPWHRPWGQTNVKPQNLVTKHEYRGINYFLTACQSFASPYWLTYRQAKELKGHVKAGEHGTPVIYWNWIKKAHKDPDTEQEHIDSIPFLKYYTVFNATQCELPADKVPAVPDLPLNDLQPIEVCEKVKAEMPNPPTMKEGEQRAYYRPSQDLVNMPLFASFGSSEEYYSTLFHELSHSTGHQSRLNRAGITDISPFGSCDYSKEELVAEMGAAFLCGYTGIENKTIDNSAAYLNGWLSKLKGDKKLVIIAAAQAQKASDYILNKLV